MTVEKMIENLEELSELARLTQCESHVPISQLKDEFEKALSRNTDKIAYAFHKLQGDPKKQLIGGVVLGLGWIGAAAIDKVKNEVAKNKTNEKVAAMGKELAVKAMEISEKNTKMVKELQDLLREQTEKGKDNSEKIKKLTGELEMMQNLLQRITKYQNSVKVE